MTLFCRILWKKNKVAETEAITFSIFYNNALYLFLILIASFYVLRTFNPAAYPLHYLPLLWELLLRDRLVVGLITNPS